MENREAGLSFCQNDNPTFFASLGQMLRSGMFFLTALCQILLYLLQGGVFQQYGFVLIQ